MYQIIGDQRRVRDAVRIWREKMNVDPDGRVTLPEICLWGEVNGPPEANGKAGNTFRVQAARRPNAVEINIPGYGTDDNVLGTVAEDENGRRWILRQGLLRQNGELGGVPLREFAQHTTLPS